MAQEQTTLLIDVQVSASEALKRQEELKVALQQQREELKKLEVEQGKTSQAYIAQEATVKNLNNQLAANGRVLAQMAGTTSTVSGAYAELNQRSAQAAARAKDLAAAYGMNDERAKAAAKEAKALSDQLKEVDSSVGQNQRRVGDYAGELGKLPGAMGGVVNGATNIKGAFNALSTTPLLGIFQLLMIVFGALSKAMGGGSEASMKLKQALAPLTTLFNGLQTVLTDIVGLFVKGASVISGFVSKALDFIPAVNKMNEASARAIELEKERQKIAEENRTEIVNDARDEMKIADLKVKMTQKHLYSDKQRLAFAREADKIYRDMMVDDVARATRKYNNMVKQMKAEGKQYKDLTTEEKDALRDAEAAMFNIRKEFRESTRKLAANESNLIMEIEADKNKKIEENNKAIEKRNEERAKKKKEQIEADKKAEDERIKQLKDNADKAIAALDYELQMFQLKQEEAAAKTNQTNQQIYNDKISLINEQYLNEGIKLEEKLANEQITQAEYDSQAILLLQQKNTATAQENQAFEQAERERKLAAQAIDFQNEMAIAEMQNQLMFDLQLKQLEKERLAELAEAEKTGADKLLIEQKYSEAKKQLAFAENQAKMGLASDFAGNIAEIFGKNTKVGKMAASAQIAIDTAKGAMAAFASFQTLPPPFGQILGGVAAGAVISKGIRSIKDVWAVKSGLPGDSGGGGASIPTSAAGGSSTVTGALVARNSGQTQQAATSQAVDAAMKANPVQPVLVTNDLTTALDQKVQIKSDNSL